MSFDFQIPSAGGAYGLPQSTLDFWARELIGAAPVVTPQSLSISEDAEIGALVGTMIGSDDDGDVLTWSIRSGNVGSAFALDAETGELTVAAALDHHERASYTLVVRATDPSGRAGEAAILIALISTSPVVTPATFAIGEFAEIGTVVGTVEATDPNGDEIEYAITAGNTGGAFSIDAATGVITVAAELDYETKAQYQLTVLATDSTGRWGAAEIVVDILDEAEIYLPPAPALIKGLKTSWTRRAADNGASARLAWSDARPLDLPSVAAWQRLRALGVDRALGWTRTTPGDLAAHLPWLSGMHTRDADLRLAWRHRSASDVARDLPWAPAERQLDQVTDLHWRAHRVADLGVTVLYTRFDDAAPQGTWFDGAQEVLDGADVAVAWPRPGLDFHVRLTDAYARPQVTLDFSVPEIGVYEAAPPIAIRWAPYRAPSLRPIAVDAITRFAWSCGRANDRSLGLIAGPLTELPGAGIEIPWRNDPPDYTQIVVPPLKVYNTMNTISVVRLPERTPINPIGLSLEYDDSNFCWTGTLVLFSETEANLLKPTPSTTREIEVTVNGFTAVLTVESRARERRYPQQQWTLQAKGRQAYLAEPYARPRSLISTTLKSAAQLAIDELPSGWSLTWSAPDWNIPAGMWSYNGLTPIRAIARLAEAVGAIVQPDPVDKKITVRSRYPVSPVEWYTATPNYSLPDALCTTLRDRDQPGQRRNQVIVEATRAPGVRVVATRAGTSGDDPLPSITEELCTAVACGTERGRVELDATGPWIDQTIAIPILPTTGVILPGALIEVTEGANAWRGLLRAVAIGVQRVDKGWAVGQTLRIERREEG